ncbi:hypothetical protein, partial [Anaerotignum lactatifermentans]|uniref:hypothetical protein n=1 Tax=Anaerotignum lactatifermentans TaxID=160404 RepID=UPI0030806E38
TDSIIPEERNQISEIKKSDIFPKNIGSDYKQNVFYIFKNAERFGKQGISQLESAVGIYFRRGKQ